MSAAAVDLERLAALALACVRREYPNQPGHVLRGPADAKRPRELHPAFYGCYDWHSAVHGHWLLAHAFGLLSKRDEIGLVLSQNLTAPNLAAEAAYLEANPAFERPYGWAWLLKLALEVEPYPQWRDALQPVVEVVEKLYLAWLPRQAYPIRSGTHTNSAFGLSFALDFARRRGRTALEEAIVRRAREWFGEDRDYPAGWEPGGNDFFSPCLVEADLMRRVADDFPQWFARFLPRIPPSLQAPAGVSDRSDGQLVHLEGLNLSRAWCFYNLGLRELADRHFAAGSAQLASGHYAGEHWLATFAAYAAACAFDGATTMPAARSAATWRE